MASHVSAEIPALLWVFRRLHEHIRDRVVAVCERSDPEILGDVARVMQEDTIYHVDRVGEAELVAFLTQHAPADIPFILVAEGLTEGHLVFPHDAHEAEVRWRILMDPIDGTRGLMYQKRSAWILTGVAPNLGEDTALSDIAFAIQTEIPLVKQHLSDTLWAVRGQGAHAERVNRFTGERRPLTLRPSRAKTIEHGFSTVARFFPGGRDLLAALDDALAEALIGPVEPGRAQCFEDQYISTGGQLYELMAGHDRFVADVRPYLARALADRGASTGICCHPYDLCTKLIAEEAGVCIVDPAGGPVDAPLQLHHDIAWAGYANAALQALIEPILIEQMSRLGMIEPVPHST